MRYDGRIVVGAGIGPIRSRLTWMGRAGLDLQLVDNQSWVDEGTISRVSGPPGAGKTGEFYRYQGDWRGNGGKSGRGAGEKSQVRGYQWSSVQATCGAEGVREGTRGGGTGEWKKIVTLGEETKGRGTGPKS